MGTPPATTRRQRAWDLVLALSCVAIGVAIQVTGVDARSPDNRQPGCALGRADRRRAGAAGVARQAPLAVLAACFPGFLALIAARYSVGAAPIGVLIAFYTAAAWGARRQARLAIAVMAVGYGLGLALRPIDLGVEGALVQTALVVGGWIVGTGMRERRELHAVQVADAGREVERERERADFERERAAHAAIEERLGSRRELHDIVGHALSVMVVQAGVAEHLIDSSPSDARRAVGEIARTGRTSLAEMRRLLHVLRDDDGPAVLPRDPAPALADLPELIDRVQAAGLAVELVVTGDPSTLPAALSAGLELAAYRVIQEALTNSIKHAHATRARVRLTYGEGSLAIEIRDDGRQDAPVPSQTSTGHGLVGMRERTAMYGGEFTAGPSVDGYLVSARLPVPLIEAGVA